MAEVISQKGKNMILKDGYRYRHARLNADGSNSWRCVVPTCAGRIKRYPDASENVVTDHNHAPNPAANEMETVKAKMRQRALDGMGRPRHVIQQTTSGISLEAASLLPSYAASQRMIERKRKRNYVGNAAPRSRQEIAIPDELLRTTRGDNFLLWDSGPEDENRIIVFGTERNMDLLEENRHWFVDGTFKVAPELFMQLFTIHALLDNSATPLIYALLPSKSEATYGRLFQKLVELRPNFNPISLMADFELACHNAARAVFPQTRIVGCLFHLGQNLWRKVQDLGLANQYAAVEEIRMQTKMLVALAFVPPEDVAEAFDELCENCPAPLQPLYDYWEDTYVGRRRRIRRAIPTFNIVMWNVRDRVLQGLPRTNNSVEGWHRAFQQTVDCQHPTVLKLVEHFRREQDLTEQRVERFLSGDVSQPASKNKYVRLTRRLLTLVEAYGTRPRNEFLRGVSHNIDL